MSFMKLSDIFSIKILMLRGSWLRWCLNVGEKYQICDARIGVQGAIDGLRRCTCDHEDIVHCEMEEHDMIGRP